MQINKIFVIHYTKLKERKEKILELLKNFTGEIEFVEVLDKENISASDLKKVYFPNAEDFENKVRPLWDVNLHRFRYLNEAEVSCTMKHIYTFKKIMNENNDHVLIIEDDILPLTDDFITKIENLLDNAPKDWDVIYLSEGIGMDFVNSKIQSSEKFNDQLIKASHPASNCTDAYLWTKKAAEKAYKALMPFQLVIDWELSSCFYKNNMNVYWMVNPLFKQGSKTGKYKSELR